MQIPTPPAVGRTFITSEGVPVEMPPAQPAQPQPKAARPRRPKRTAEPPETRLANARTWLQAGRPEDALGAYESLIKANQFLDEVVTDLEAASERSPDRRLLRALGDAYMRQDRLQKALDTYRLALGGQ
jgi:tetratricopeptide (TPR) repeat protein